MKLVALEGVAVKGEENVSAKAAGLPSSAEVETALRERFDEILGEVRRRGTDGYCSLRSVELYLFAAVLGLGRLFLQMFLRVVHESFEVPRAARRGWAKYERQGPKARTLRTLFGKLRYERFYMHKKNGTGGGYFPLDEKVGLTADGFSLPVLGWAAQLATKMSYAAAASVLKGFLGWAPSPKSIEKSVLGLGAYAEEYLDQLPPPDEDGEVLIIQIDGKGIPTATDAEMEKRRGERPKRTAIESARHRGREMRRRLGPRPRRKRGDKAKNAKVVHVIVLYTLRREFDEQGNPVLVGPLNKRVYVCTTTKRDAVRRARRLADKRGYTAKSGKAIQILTDGDETYAEAIADDFPKVVANNRHTLDMLHGVEYLWEAAYLLEPDDRDARSKWVADRKSEMCTDALEDMLGAMRSRLEDLDDTEPALAVEQRKSKDRPKKRKTPRQKLRDIIGYFEKRLHMMNYQELAEADLEWATGIAEGAVRYVLSHRFDDGSMRWIRERSARLMYLRCIEINGCWDHFIDHVHDKLSEQARRSKAPPRLLTNTAPPLCSQDADAA